MLGVLQKGRARCLRIAVFMIAVLSCVTLGNCGGYDGRLQRVLHITLGPRFESPTNQLPMHPLDKPLELHRVRLLRIPTDWVIRSQKRYGGENVKLTIDTGNWGMFQVLAFPPVYGSVDTSPEQWLTKNKIEHIESACRLPVRGCPTAFYSYFREQYPSEKSLVAAYSQLQPGTQLADRAFVNRTEHATLVVASLGDVSFDNSIASKVPHESLDMYVGGGARWVAVYIFQKNSTEGTILHVKPGDKQDRNLSEEEIARRLALVGATLIDGLTAGT